MHSSKPRLFFILIALILLRPATSAQAPERSVYRVAIMADLYTEEFGTILGRLLEETRAVVGGEDAKLEFPADLRFFNDFDRSVAEAQYTELTSGKADLILVFGTVSSRVLNEQQAFGVPTILFGSTNLEMAGFDPQRAQSGIPDFTYIITLQSFEEDLETFRKLTEFENIGIALEASEIQSLPVQEAFDKILLRDSIQYRLIPFGSLV